jgi:hypothetical protein
MLEESYAKSGDRPGRTQKACPASLHWQGTPELK